MTPTKTASTLATLCLLVACSSGRSEATSVTPPTRTAPSTATVTESGASASSSPREPSPSAPATCRSGTAPKPRSDRVLAFFPCRAETDTGANTLSAVAVQRPIDADATTAQRLRRAVLEYLRGPTAQERTAGLWSLKTPTRMLNSVSVTHGRAVIDLDLAAAHLTSTSSAQSELLWTHLSALAFQFPEITLMEPRFNGSCHDFGMAVEAGECLVATRDGTFVRST